MLLGWWYANSRTVLRRETLDTHITSNGCSNGDRAQCIVATPHSPLSAYCIPLMTVLLHVIFLYLTHNVFFYRSASLMLFIEVLLSFLRQWTPLGLWRTTSPPLSPWLKMIWRGWPGVIRISDLLRYDYYCSCGDDKKMFVLLIPTILGRNAATRVSTCIPFTKPSNSDEYCAMHVVWPAIRFNYH